MVIIYIIMVAISLFQPVLGFTGSQETNHIIYFHDKQNTQEVYIFDPIKRTSHKVFEVKEKDYRIDFDSCKSIAGSIFFTIQNEKDAEYSFIRENGLHQKILKGVIYQKDYKIDKKGNTN